MTSKKIKPTCSISLPEYTQEIERNAKRISRALQWEIEKPLSKRDIQFFDGMCSSILMQVYRLGYLNGRAYADKPVPAFMTKTPLCEHKFSDEHKSSEQFSLT